MATVDFIKVLQECKHLNQYYKEDMTQDDARVFFDPSYVAELYASAMGKQLDRMEQKIDVLSKG